MHMKSHDAPPWDLRHVKLNNNTRMSLQKKREVVERVERRVCKKHIGGIL